MSTQQPRPSAFSGFFRMRLPDSLHSQHKERHTINALQEVLAERGRQQQKWGEQNHDPITWSAILSEECGEFSQTALQRKFGGVKASELRKEAVQCAAVALQIIECINRNGL